MNYRDQALNSQAGFTLLEVVLAIAVFALGMLALIELQSGVARSSGDANLRTVAASIAEEFAEEARGYSSIEEYDNLVSWDAPNDVDYYVLRDETEGVLFTVNMLVQDYYWDADSETFVTEAPVGIVRPDYKSMDIAVMWRPLDTDVETFERHDSICFAAVNAEGNLCTDESGDSLFGGGIRLVETVPSSPRVLGALVASSRDVLGGPDVTYHPGENPDIVQITLDAEGGKFKEATTPAPDVIRDDRVETWFDVVTYSQLAGADATFLRREEFVAITCDCELGAVPADPDDYGLKPTLWNGVEYTEGAKAAKPVGVPVGPDSAQSMFCNVCCRDHHDPAGVGGNGAEDVYSLEFVGSNADHPHYTRDRRGNIIETPVGVGDEYLEACRLIRKDGFMRVTHNANQAALLGFPQGYLDSDAAVVAYSAYVTESAESYYSAGGPFPQPNPPEPGSPHVFPARTPGDATALPTALFETSQQLRSRAVYTDYLTDAAQTVIDECFPLADRTPDCAAPNASTPLEIYPFFDLQMTWLAAWNIDPLTGLVSVTSDPIESGNSHSRGLLALTSEALGQSNIQIESSSDNMGLTATGAIDPLHDSRETSDTMYVNANDGGVPAPPIGYLVSGSLTSALRRVPAGDLLLTPTPGGALCGHTDTEWSCAVLTPGAMLTISNYYLNVPRTYACSDMAFVAEDIGLDATTFTLPAAAGTYDIWITDDFSICPR